MKFSLNVSGNVPPFKRTNPTTLPCPDVVPKRLMDASITNLLLATFKDAIFCTVSQVAAPLIQFAAPEGLQTFDGLKSYCSMSGVSPEDVQETYWTTTGADVTVELPDIGLPLVKLHLV